MDHELEVYRQHRTSQDKYTYFLLAAAGAAIALALNQTQGAPLKWSQVPLAGAVLLWGFSFFCGCRQLGYINSTLFANAELLRVQRGIHPQVGRHPDHVAAASEGIKSAMETNSDRANRYAHLQLRLFFSGALFYIAWHMYEMWLRVPA